MNEFRLPADTRIGTVALQIADLERSLDYYQHVLGFQVLQRLEESGIRTARLGVGERGLLELHEKRGVRPVPRRGLLGLYHFAVLLPNRPALGRFLRHINTLGVHAGASDHLVSEALYLTDPDGITIEVYRDRPRAEWRVHNGEIQMSTIPLDADAVLASAGDGVWQALPEHTTIGHMHFYVADIPVAASFYEAGLGFTRANWSYPGALFVAAGGYHHHVGLNTWAAGSPIASADDAGLLFWELLLPDEPSRSAAVASLRRGGYDVSAAAEAWAARDPWGITVRLTTRTAAP